MTREEAIELLEKEKIYMISHGGNMQAKALDMAIKAVNEEHFKNTCIKQASKEQDSILDQIIAEIQRLRGCSCSCSDGIIDDVEDIIDKYKAEMESEE